MAMGPTACSSCILPQVKWWWGAETGNRKRGKRHRFPLESGSLQLPRHLVGDWQRERRPSIPARVPGDHPSPPPTSCGGGGLDAKMFVCFIKEDVHVGKHSDLFKMSVL